MRGWFAQEKRWRQNDEIATCDVIRTYVGAVQHADMLGTPSPQWRLRKPYGALLKARVCFVVRELAAANCQSRRCAPPYFVTACGLVASLIVNGIDKCHRSGRVICHP